MTSEYKLKAKKMSKMTMPSSGFIDADGNSINSPEYKLKCIIEDQVKGGCGSYAYIIEYDRYEFNEEIENLLTYLLDTEGLKATYGKEVYYCNSCRRHHDTFNDCDSGIGNNWMKYEYASHEILDAWHSGEGNNWEAAIDTAYNLLPA